LTVIGGVAVGFLGAKNILTPEQLDQISTVFNSEEFAAIIVPIGTLIWSMFVHSNSSIIKNAANLPEVNKVELVHGKDSADIVQKVGSTSASRITVAPAPVRGG
jgi:hypothetical protein